LINNCSFLDNKYIALEISFEHHQVITVSNSIFEGNYMAFNLQQVNYGNEDVEEEYELKQESLI